MVDEKHKKKTNQLPKKFKKQNHQKKETKAKSKSSAIFQISLIDDGALCYYSKDYPYSGDAPACCSTFRY
jgi:hypothetical protein